MECFLYVDTKVDDGTKPWFVPNYGAMVFLSKGDEFNADVSAFWWLKGVWSK